MIINNILNFNPVIEYTQCRMMKINKDKLEDVAQKSVSKGLEVDSDITRNNKLVSEIKNIDPVHRSFSNPKMVKYILKETLKIYHKQKTIYRDLVISTVPTPFDIKELISYGLSTIFGSGILIGEHYIGTINTEKYGTITYLVIGEPFNGIKQVAVCMRESTYGDLLLFKINIPS